MHTSNPVLFIIWLCLLALGCFGGPYWLGGNRWGYAGGLAMFIAILMLKLMAF